MINNPFITAKRGAKFLAYAYSNSILICILLMLGCSSPPVTEFTVSIDKNTFNESPVVAELNREAGHLVKIVLKGYVPFSTRAEFKDRRWMFANLKFGKQILLALDVTTGYLYKLLPQHMSYLLQKENTTSLIEQDKLYLIAVQEPDESTWWRNIARLKPIVATKN